MRLSNRQLLHSSQLKKYPDRRKMRVMVNSKKSPAATQGFVDKRVNELGGYVKGEIDLVRYEAKEFRKEMNQRFDELNTKFDKMMDNMDWLAGAYQKFGEEHTVLSQHNSDNSDEIDDLKERVAKLERIVQKLTAQ